MWKGKLQSQMSLPCAVNLYFTSQLPNKKFKLSAICWGSKFSATMSQNETCDDTFHWNCEEHKRPTTYYVLSLICNTLKVILTCKRTARWHRAHDKYNRKDRSRKHSDKYHRSHQKVLLFSKTAPQIGWNMSNKSDRIINCKQLSLLFFSLNLIVVV